MPLLSLSAISAPATSSKATALVWPDDSGTLVVVQFDVVKSETHEETCTVTDHPVEKGVNIVDHVRVEPRRLSFEGYISDKPLMSNPGVAETFSYGSVELSLPEKPNGFTPTPGGVSQAVVGAISGLFSSSPPHSATAMTANGAFKQRTLDAWQKLRDAKDNSRLIVVTTPIEFYENMVIERISAPRTISDGTGITIQIDLREIKIVESETVAAPQPTELRGQLTQALGSKSPPADDPAAATKKKSVLAAILDGATAGPGGLSGALAGGL